MVIYITEQGLKISRESQRLRFEARNGKAIQEVRLAEIEEIVVFGRVSFTTPAIHALLKRNINIHFLTLSGVYLGKLSPPIGKNVELRIKQHEFFKNPETRIELARKFVYGKILNQKQYLSRQKRRLGENSLESITLELKRALKMLDSVNTIDEIMGIEGMASKLYYKGLSLLLKNSAFSFKGRTRRPPTDPVNALLSLGYTLLLARIWGLVETAGFDPYIGFLHSPDYGKPSLILDLMEEWRPVIVDSVVIRVLNWGTIKKEDFTKEVFPDEEDENEISAIKLTRSGLKKFIAQFQQRLKEETTYPLFNKRFRYQDIMREQVYLLARVLKGEAEEYKAFEMT